MRLSDLKQLWPLAAGLGGGLGLGLVLSRRGEWLAPTPWLVYGLILILLVGIAAWWTESRRL